MNRILGSAKIRESYHELATSVFDEETDILRIEKSFIQAAKVQ